MPKCSRWCFKVLWEPQWIRYAGLSDRIVLLLEDSLLFSLLPSVQPCWHWNRIIEWNWECMSIPWLDQKGVVDVPSPPQTISEALQGIRLLACSVPKSAWFSHFPSNHPENCLTLQARKATKEMTRLRHTQMHPSSPPTLKYTYFGTGERDRRGRARHSNPWWKRMSFLPGLHWDNCTGTMLCQGLAWSMLPLPPLPPVAGHERVKATEGEATQRFAHILMQSGLNLTHTPQSWS